MKQYQLVNSFFCLFFLFGFSTCSFASIEQIKHRTEQLKLTNIEIKPSPIKELYYVFSDQGLFYFSDNADYFIRGDIFTFDKNNQLNQLSMNVLKEKIDKLVKTDGIIYKSPNELTKVTVFTDISCSYCKKLHNEITSYTNEGITIQYLAFPRAGVDSEIGKQMQSIWCANSKAEQVLLLDQGFNNQLIPENSCKPNQPKIETHFSLANQLGIEGTPAIFLENGQLISGYVPAKKLKLIINEVK